MNAPTLLIGLGGTGSKIIARVSAMVSPAERNNISFAVFDTDINELEDIKKKYPFVKTIQTSTRQTVGEYLNIDTHARDTWFPVNGILNSKALSEGAGQVRSISRLALETAIRSGKMEPLHEAIQELYKVEEDKREQALRVVIVSSLAGGTGSGLILPVALYVRNYLKTHYRLGANITRGFFILPEVFYNVIKGPTERNNLKANAYAAIRELDAFLMKSDGTLHERYEDSVAIKFPKVASEGFEEYDVRPYDFCFLFDAQNADGGKLNSFNQYLDQAATCIYAQSIGPMNKRSNSSEDNTIRKLANEQGRNRYAGAGVSMLVYPFEDIRKLFALKWAQQSVSSLWLKYDNLFKQYMKENADLRDAGIATNEPLTLSQYYVNQIEADAKDGHAFASAIVVASGIYFKGVTRKADKWNAYVESLSQKIEEDVTNASAELTQSEEEIGTTITNLTAAADWKDFASAWDAIVTHEGLTKAYLATVTQTIAYSLFRGSHGMGVKNSDQPYKIEYYIAPGGEYIHPNAARYLLIKILERMKQVKNQADEAVRDVVEQMAMFEEDCFDDKRTKKIETADDLSRRKKTIYFKREKNEMIDKFGTYMDYIKEYKENYSKSQILSEGIAYIKSLIASYESFFGSFESKVDGIEKEINNIYKKYGESKGTTVRYVCASKKCLDKMYAKKPYTGGVIAIDAELSQTIYDNILAYTLLAEKPNPNRYFNNLFDDGIIGYYEKTVMKKYGAELDIDVITALENEADYVGGFEDADDAYERILLYVEKVIQDTKKLACPFIEAPLGESQDPINSCAFNSDLDPKDDDSPRAMLIRSELCDFGGTSDDDVPKNKIMFYKSFYGLRANDLSKFAPPEKSATYDRDSGEYFKAYFELIEGIHPATQKSRGISPHCDRWWHIITKMPDIDDDNQLKQENRIYAAFFWSIYFGWVKLQSEKNKQLYKFNRLFLDMSDDSLIVSNGTDCDKLYEVLDAIAIYPELTTKILEKLKNDISVEIEKGIPLTTTKLYKRLDAFEIQEPMLGSTVDDNRKKSTCIFDIPLLMKKSATQDVYYEEDVIRMLTVAIEEIKKYMLNFCSKEELPSVFSRFVIGQLEMHLESLNYEKQFNPNVYKESLFEKTYVTIYKALLDVGCDIEAEEIYEKCEKLTK